MTAHLAKIELLPERLFIVGADIFNLINATSKVDHAKTTAKKQVGKVLTTVKPSPQQPVSQGDGVVDEILPHAKEVESQISDEKLSIQCEVASIATMPTTIIRLKQVQERTGLSRSTIYDKINPKSPRHDPLFPKQLNLGIGSVGWVESEITAWLDERKNARC